MPCLIRIAQEESSFVNGCQFNIKNIEYSTNTGCLLKIRQIEKQKQKEYYFNSSIHKEPFNLVVSISGVEFDFCKLKSQIKITQAVNSSRIAELTVAADKGLLDFYKYASKKIDIVYSSSTETKTIYSGIIITQKLDKNNGVFNLTASDEKINKIDNLPQSAIDSIGHYCPELFNEELTKKDIFAKRIESIPADYYFDNDGNFVLTNWQPKEKADIYYCKTQNECDVLSLSFSVANINEIVNKIEISFSFNYDRYIQRDITGSYNPSFSGTLFNRFINFVHQKHFIPVPRIDTVLSAVNNAGWTVGNFTYEQIPSLSNTYIVIPDKANYVLSASWTFSKRWTQNVQEDYFITIKNDESINFFNEKKEEISFNLKMPDNENKKTNWQDYPCYFRPPSGSRKENNDYIQAESTENQQVFATGIQYALNVAKTKIFHSHFNNELSAELMFNKDVSLSHTIGFNTAEFSGNVKCLEIVHTFDFEKRIAKTNIKANWFKGFDGGALRQTERVALPVVSQNQGVASFGNKIIKRYSAPSLPTEAIDGVVTKDYCLSSTGEDNEYGFVLQEFIPNLLYSDNQDGVVTALKFAIKTPDIEQEMTDGLTATAEYEQNVSIPNTVFYAYIA